LAKNQFQVSTQLLPAATLVNYKLFLFSIISQCSHYVNLCLKKWLIGSNGKVQKQKYHLQFDILVRVTKPSSLALATTLDSFYKLLTFQVKKTRNIIIQCSKILEIPKLRQFVTDQCSHYIIWMMNPKEGFLQSYVPNCAQSDPQPLLEMFEK